MAGARIAAAFIIASHAACLAAQPTPQGHLTIQVVDPIGAVIPNAFIEIDPALPQPHTVIRTNNEGLAALDVPVGSHVLSVAAPSFERWTQQVDVQGGSARTVVALAVLQVMRSDWPCMVCATGPEVPLESADPGPAFISPEPLQTLAPLPSHRAKKRWW